jgi:pyruvate/2-oxoglutarate dehydrogenase complex dihydrolipoamide acyltransferase (E2) component
MIVAADVERAAALRPAAKASPVARELAASAGLDLSTVAGAGPASALCERMSSKPCLNG